MTKKEVEIMKVIEIEAICQCIGPLKVKAVHRTAGSRTLTLVWSIAWERLAETCRMREVNTELSLEDKILIDVHLGKHSREDLVLLVRKWVVLEPLERVLALSLP